VEKYGTARQATDDNIIRRMRCACWITRATDTYSEYLMLIAFRLQKWLCERALMLRYTYIACLYKTVLYNTVHCISSKLHSTKVFQITVFILLYRINPLKTKRIRFI
jgi:hypothetical protein